MDTENVLGWIDFDDRESEYRTFFNHRWARTLLDMTDNTPLRIPFADLCKSWRGVANASALPSLMAGAVASGINGNDNGRQKSQRETIRAVSAHFARLIGPSDPQLLNRLEQEQACLELRLSAEIPKVNRQLQCKSGDIWRSFFVTYEWPWALFGLQQMSFNAVVFSYEEFIQQCIRVATSNPSFSTRSKRIGDELEKAFNTTSEATIGSLLRRECWDAPLLAASRDVRNALVHNGGRIEGDATIKARLTKHSFRIHDSTVVVFPENIHALTGALATCVTSLCRETVSCFRNVN